MNLSPRYSGLSTLNHWIAALLVIVMLVLGLVADEAPTDVTEDYVLGVHISLGFFTFFFIVWRISYRLYEGFPPALGNSPAERRAAYVVHRLLLLVLAIQVVTGPLYLFTEGEGVNVFGWFGVYVPLEGLAVIHEPMEEIHELIGAYVIPLLLLLHVAGAIKHYLGDDLTKDEQKSPADL